MSDFLLRKLAERREPIDVVVVGFGFMSFGFIAALENLPGMRVPLVITRRPEEAKQFLEEKGFKAVLEDNYKKIVELAAQGYIALSKNVELVTEYENNIIAEMTGDISYGIDIALRAFAANKHLVTMNVEMQTTVGSELKKVADKANLIITDSLGDQPGCLSRLINQVKFMGFKPLVVGNMKRYLNVHDTQAEKQAYANDFGATVKKITSFADGTKQAMELNLVANYFGMKVIKPGMMAPQVSNINEIPQTFAEAEIPAAGAVDFVLGSQLSSGIFVVAEHPDPHQQRYLRYVGLGTGPRYLLSEPNHLCHLELAATIAKVVFLEQETINNTLNPTTKTVTIAKADLRKGQVLDGIGGDLAYGTVYSSDGSEQLLPMGIAEGAVLNNDIAKDQPISVADVSLPDNAATRLLNL